MEWLILLLFLCGLLYVFWPRPWDDWWKGDDDEDAS